MDESPLESDLQAQDERAQDRPARHWRSCLLLFVMFLGILATPLAVIFRWSQDRQNSRALSGQIQESAINRIAYITPDLQVATIAPDGSDARRLTDASHGFEFPAWDPDGRRLAATGGDKVVLIDIGGRPNGSTMTSDLYDSADEPPFYLYWSPDGRYLSFLTSHAEGIALHIADTAGIEVSTEELATGQPFYWDWAPAADHLLVHSGSSGANSRLEMIDLVGNSTEGDFGEPGFFQAPGISPSGHYAAYATLDERGRSRLVLQQDNGDEQRYEAHLGQLALSWSPMADVLAYKSPRLNSPLGGGPLRLLDPRTGESTSLSSDNVLAFFWSPDGQTIAYFTLPRNGGGNVRVAAADAKEPHRARRQRQPGELRMELWAVDVAGGHQRRLAQFVPTTLFLRQFLPFFDQYALSHRIWSPDSSALVIPIFEDGRSQIAVVPLNSEPVRLIADGQIAFWSHQ